MIDSDETEPTAIENEEVKPTKDKPRVGTLNLTVSKKYRHTLLMCVMAEMTRINEQGFVKLETKSLPKESRRERRARERREAKAKNDTRN